MNTVMFVVGAALVVCVSSLIAVAKVARWWDETPNENWLHGRLSRALVWLRRQREVREDRRSLAAEDYAFERRSRLDKYTCLSDGRVLRN